MGIVWWCAAVPVILVVIRKYRQYKWGYFKEVKCLQNKVFVVTGASSGIGKETVRELAKRKARVIMGCRDVEKAKRVIKEIRTSVKSGELIPMEIDLASLDSIRNFAKEVMKDFPEIHVLINNAGVSIPYPAKTKDGYEANFGINHLGHFLLTKLLTDKLKASAPSRVVVVSSSLHEKGTIDFDNLQGEKGHTISQRNPAYNNSKLANVYFGKHLAHLLETKNVQVFTVCPGFCFTKLFRHSDIKWFQYILFAPIAFFYMRSAAQGSQTILYCALSDEVDGKSGQIFRDCKTYNSKHNFNKEVEQKLWDISEQLVK